MAWGSPFQLPRESTGWLIWELTNTWQRLMSQTLEKYKLTSFQYLVLRCLWYLERQEQFPTQIELSNLTHSHPMMVSKVVRNLISAKLISRRLDFQDNRARILALTETGKTVVETAYKDVREINQELFNILEDQENVFVENLEKLLAHSNILSHSKNISQELE